MEAHTIEFVGGVIGLLIALVGWSLSRNIGQIDDTMKGLSADHRHLATDLQEVKSDLQAANQLREFQDRRIEALEKEKRSLYNAFNAMDRLISRKWGESTPLVEE
jgi:hypothetical protein